MTDGRLARTLNFEDLRRAASRTLPRGVFEYVDGGAEDELTMRRNVEGFREIVLRPAMGVWVPEPDLSTELFGTRLSMPVLTAPCGGMRLVHPDGDLGVARGAAAAGTIHVAAAASGYPLEDIAAIDGPQWFQLHSFAGRGRMEALVHRAADAGYGAMVLTLDCQVVGNREQDFRNGFSYSMRVDARNAMRMAPQLVGRPSWVWRYWRDGMPFAMANFRRPDGTQMLLSEIGSTKAGGSGSPTWEDVAWVREHWSAPLLIKGVLTGHDARRAVALGADGVIVSNHGGRQLDSAPASIDALPEVVAAVGEQTQVLMDGGVRRGTDVLKAIALGANAVLVGRPYVFGLAAAGEAGVRHTLELLRSEVLRAMRLMGVDSVSALNESWVDYRHRQRRG